MCMGNVCDTFKDRGKVCSPQKDVSTYKCIDPTQACEREKAKEYFRR